MPTARASRGARSASRPPARRARRGWARRRWPVLAAVAVVAAAGGGLGGWAASRSGPAPASLPATLTPPAYHVVYRVEMPGSPTQQDIRDVDRPFTGRTLTKNADGSIAGGSLTTDDGAYLYRTDSPAGWATISKGRHAAAGDQAAAPALSYAVQHDLAEVVGHDRVLGRACTEVRTGGPIGEPVTRPTAGDHADLCIDDRTGLVLREVWVLHGKPARTRTAVALDAAPAFASDTFAPKPAGRDLSSTPGMTIVQPLTKDPAAALPLRFEPPAGYHFVAAQTEGTLSPAGPITTLVVYYLDGDRLLTLRTGDLPDLPGTLRVDLPGGRHGRLALDLIASRLTVTVGGTSVQLESQDPGLLVRAAAGLHTR